MVVEVLTDESRLPALFEVLPDAVIVADAEGRHLDLNSAATRLLGYDREEFARIGPIDLVAGVPSETEDEYQRLIDSGQWHGTCLLRRKDGSSVLVEANSAAVTAASGTVYVSVLRDLSERSRREQLAQLGAIVESSDDAIIGKSLDGTITSWNGGAQRMYGYSPDEVIGRSIALIIPPDHPHELPEILARLRRGERIDHFETERIAKDGRRLAVSNTISPIRDASGRIIGASTIARDITERRQAEQALRVSLSQLQTILQSAAEGITVQSADGRLIYANNAAAHICGYASAAALLAATSEQVGARFQMLDERGELLDPGAFPGRIALREHRPAEAIVRYRIVATRAERWSLVRAVPVEGPDDPAPMVVNVFQDITALKQEETQAQFLAQASELLARTLDYEATLAQIAQLAVPALADWASVDVLEADGGIRRLAVAHADPAKLAWAHELERRYPIDPEDTAGVANVIRTGEPEYYETIPQDLLESFATDDETARILHELHLTSSIVVPLQARGRTLGALSFIFAESERHYSGQDLRFAQNLAVRAALALDNAGLYRDALAALHVRDEFLASVSHDLRTPLTTVRGSTQLVLRQLNRLATPQLERAIGTLTNIDRASRRIETMIGALLDITRLESGRPLDIDRQQIDLVSLIRELIDEHQRGAPGHQLRLESEMPQIRGAWDPARLERVIDNLLSNAVKYSPHGGAVTVTVRVERDDQTLVDQAVITVEDQGIGIPAADLPRLFERFHRGSNVPRRTPGIGIGLAGAKQIVELHGGTLGVESEEGSGARFTLRLPIAARDTEEG